MAKDKDRKVLELPANVKEQLAQKLDALMQAGWRGQLIFLPAKIQGEEAWCAAVQMEVRGEELAIAPLFVLITDELLEKSVIIPNGGRL